MTDNVAMTDSWMDWVIGSSYTCRIGEDFVMVRKNSPSYKEMHDWLITHNCVVSRELYTIVMYDFPSEEVRNWYILRWS